MPDSCPYCEKPVPTGQIMCPNCGSYVIKVEDAQRRWLKFLLPGAVIVLAGIFFVLLAIQQNSGSDDGATVRRPLDRSVVMQNRQEQKVRERVETRQRTFDTVRRKEEQARKDRSEWQQMPEDKKAQWVQTRNAELSSRISQILSGESAGDHRGDIEALQQQLTMVPTFIESAQYTTARELLLDVEARLSAMNPPPSSEVPEAPAKATVQSDETTPENP